MVRVATGRDAFRRLAADAPPTARIPVAVRLTVSDPFEAYRRAREPTGGVYLGTTGGQSGWGYFATAPAEFTEVGPDGGETLGALTDVLAGETLVRGDCEVPYPCGAIGWLSYDVVRELESLPERSVADRALPRLQLATYDRVAAWEEPRGDGDVTLTITACPRLDEFETAELAYEFGRQHALELARDATEGDTAVGDPPVEADSAAFESDCTQAEFAERVRTVKEYIRDGDTFQANISQRLTAPAAVHPVEAFDALRRVNPAP
jgi:anthranilate synthase component 1